MIDFGKNSPSRPDVFKKKICLKCVGGYKQSNFFEQTLWTKETENELKRTNQIGIKYFCYLIEFGIHR